ncbi:MAG: hypothetical protein ACLFTH_03370 [Candidatus Woesearchaeota archaeon]
MTPDATISNHEQDETIEDPVAQDFYSKDTAERLLEDDELSLEEALFVSGYDEYSDLSEES